MAATATVPDSEATIASPVQIPNGQQQARTPLVFNFETLEVRQMQHKIAFVTSPAGYRNGNFLICRKVSGCERPLVIEYLKPHRTVLRFCLFTDSEAELTDNGS
jgi:hypothetical protein